LEEINLGETDEDLENLKFIESYFSSNPNAPLNLDCVRNFLFFSKINLMRIFR